MVGVFLGALEKLVELLFQYFTVGFLGFETLLKELLPAGAGTLQFGDLRGEIFDG